MGCSAGEDHCAQTEMAPRLPSVVLNTRQREKNTPKLSVAVSHGAGSRCEGACGRCPCAVTAGGGAAGEEEVGGGRRRRGRRREGEMPGLG